MKAQPKAPGLFGAGFPASLFRAPSLVLLAALLCGVACREEAFSAGRDESTAATAPLNDSPRKAQPKLPTTKLFVGTNEIVAEIASTRDQISTGMMWRTNMAEVEGMLFVFGGPTKVSFYMRNTVLPLSCAYIDPEGVILELHRSEEHTSELQ